MPSGPAVLSRRIWMERFAIGSLMTVIVSVLGGVALLTPRGDSAPAQMKFSRNDTRSIVPVAAVPSTSSTISPDSFGAQAPSTTPSTFDQPSVTNTSANGEEIAGPPRKRNPLRWKFAKSFVAVPSYFSRYRDIFSEEQADGECRHNRRSSSWHSYRSYQCRW